MNAQYDEITSFLKANADEQWRKGMERYAISTDKAFGIPVPVLRNLAKKYKNNHPLALELWQSGYHEARVLAAMIADGKQTTPQLMDSWVADFDSWDVCDMCCSSLFRYIPFAVDKIYEYAQSDQEYVKRTAFSLIATMAIGNKELDDKVFIPFLELIIKASCDDRNFVKKAVNWALRQTGKRSRYLHAETIKVAQQLFESDNRTARWIGGDALREFGNPKIIARIK